ncbi:hypothetical protein GCM10010425_34550 [Streptomyces spororaveus]|uniref:Integral membrane protein n=1 Tax=Streptomyces spororaveus TaxID=284039 RepID=A0ABQ3TBW7_9ACTN|nr:hypothetical protein [Streptomyces spororaveus]GHI77901.1 hypothetical protein Sspor_34620 [Streptomyces spororaveus]
MTTVDPRALNAGEPGTAPVDAEGARREAERAPRGAGPAGGGLAARPPRRKSAGDPVKALLHRHRELCERAVDPLEIAAGLEAHGITDRTAARFRHRDVFSLAEELYARSPHEAVTAAAPALVPAGPAAFRGFGQALLPAAVACSAAAAGQAWAGVAAVAAVAAALVWPGRAAAGRFPHAAHLLAAAVAAGAVYRHGTALGVGLALAVVPGHLAAVAFAAGARARLDGSRALEDFADRARPLLLAATALFTGAAAGAAVLAGAPLPVAVPLALLLFLTRLLLRHGAHRAPICAALALALVPVPAAATAAAAGLLVHAVLALARASAHARP